MSARKRARKAEMAETPEVPDGKLKGKDYDHELAKLHVELVKLQQWTVQTRASRSVSCSKDATAPERAASSRRSPNVSVRACSVWSHCQAPTEREKSQMYIQRYIPHLPAAGEIVIFDRSWYNRPASSG